MSVSSQIERLNSAKAAIIDAIVAQGVTVPNEAMLDDLAAYVLQIALSSNADTIDGLHLDVRSDGTAPTDPYASENSITLVYGG